MLTLRLFLNILNLFNLSLRLKEHKTNCEKAELEKSAVAKHSWTNDHRIKWNEASILATESHKFSRKMRESIEIEKHSTIDQEGKPLDSTWRALFTMQEPFRYVRYDVGDLTV